MTFLNTIAEDTNAFTCCSQACPYFPCFFYTWCAYEGSLRTLSWANLQDLPQVRAQHCAQLQFPAMTWRKPPEPVKGVKAARSPYSCSHRISHPEGNSSTWKRLTSFNWFESVFTRRYYLCWEQGDLTENFGKPHFCPAAEQRIWKTEEVLSALSKWLKLQRPPATSREQLPICNVGHASSWLLSQDLYLGLWERPTGNNMKKRGWISTLFLWLSEWSKHVKSMFIQPSTIDTQLLEGTGKECRNSWAYVPAALPRQLADKAFAVLEVSQSMHFCLPMACFFSPQFSPAPFWNQMGCTGRMEIRKGRFAVLWAPVRYARNIW